MQSYNGLIGVRLLLPVLLMLTGCATDYKVPGSDRAKVDISISPIAL